MLQISDELLHIAVCDDEVLDRQSIADSTKAILAEEGLACTVTTYPDGAELLAAVQQGMRFHILLLDVVMEPIDGMDFAAALRKLGDNTAIVFISINREMALRGYEVSAARYLAKPIQEAQLREALLHCYKTFCEGREILLPTEKGQSRLGPSDIIYVESWERGARLQLTSGPIKTSAKISDLAALLPGRSFIFCHRTILVNLAFVKHLRSHEIELADGRTLPVSKYRFPDLKKRLLGYLRG